MAYKKIGDYGIIGNLVTTALVGNDGAVDWMCLPFMDSPSVFAAILDDERGGRFLIQPAETWDSVQDYLPDTNVLRTRFRTREGVADLIDFMPIGAMPGTEGRHRLLRRVELREGRMPLRIECSPRPEYGAVVPACWRDGQLLRFGDDGEGLWLYCDRPLTWSGEATALELTAGESLWLVFGGGEPPVDTSAAAFERSLEETCGYWRDWVAQGRLGKYPADGFWQRRLDRSALVLKLLQFEESGAMAAAATMSLPAILYANRNWDYRYSWVRDTSMTLYALAEMGHLEEMGNYLKWIDAICGAGAAAELSVVYRLREPTPPDGETLHPQLRGYKGSAPVRSGQYVVVQHQHDCYGDILDTAFAASHFIGKVDMASWRVLRPLVDHVCTLWREPDNGLWEMRRPPAHYTHSKVMCWVALDRGIKIAEHYGFPAPLERWRTEREAVRADVLAHGYNAERGCFTQHYETDQVDAALLLLPLVNFLPVEDPRMAGTIAVIEQELFDRGLLLRYRLDDGLPGQESGFLICLFWYLNCLILQGRLDEVEEHLRGIGHYANPLGLFGEQYDPEYREIRGNYPQAYSHIGYAMTVLNYLDARRPRRLPRPMPWGERWRLLLRPRLLNLPPREPYPQAAPPQQGHPAQRLKREMNILRGLFYDGHKQRVDYGAIGESDYYRVFRATAASLADFDVAELQSDAERIAFWINLYNAIVVHGVVELGVMVSVRELPLFFGRVAYRVGGRVYTADDIEHGILRGNARPPNRPWRRFGRRDPRLAYAVREVDPRIHFALVCASRTCPPIEVYTADELDHQLATSAEVFVNGTSHIDRAVRRLELSEIFNWYRPDFHRSDAELVRYVADLLYDEEAAQWLRGQAPSLRLAYRRYDWRLNR